MFVVCRLTCSECKAVVALELSCRSCEASGDGVLEVPDAAPDVAEVAEDPEDPDAPEVWDVPVEDFDPHPVITVATSAAANKIATDTGVERRREACRWEVCACEIKPFMASLC